MRAFFSFFAIFSVVLTAFYLASAGEKNRKTHGDSESILLLADTMHNEKQNAKNLFWSTISKEGREQNIPALEEGLRARNVTSNFAGGGPGIEDKCPMPTPKKCVLITNCHGNYCDKDQESFRATVSRPFANTEFTASAGEYSVLDS